MQRLEVNGAVRPI